MKPKVLVPIADGSEEMEAVTIIDVLRRAGAQVTVASVGERQVTAAHGVMLVADTTISECEADSWDLVVLPGGIPGAQHLHASAPLQRILAAQNDANRFVGAICAAPAVVLQPQGLLSGRRATCHPAFADQIPSASPDDRRVVVDGHCVTSQGPGTAFEFALTLVEMLFDRARAQEVAAPMLPHPAIYS